MTHSPLGGRMLPTGECVRDLVKKVAELISNVSLFKILFSNPFVQA